MTISVKVTSTSNKIKTFKKVLRKIEKETAEVGYFKEQGIHKSSGLPYTHLADILHDGREQSGDGWRVSIPPRPFFTMGMRTLQFSIKRSRKAKTAFRAWAKNPRNKEARQNFIGAVGAVASQSIKRVIGNPLFLQSNSRATIIRKGGRNTPLVDTGDFQNKLSYRTSMDKKLRRARI